MIRYLLTAVLTFGLAAQAWAQEAEDRPDEQAAMDFVDEFAKDLAHDADAYMDRLSFPVQVSVVTGDGEVLSGTFNEDEYRLLGHLPTGEIRVHAAQQAMIRQADEMLGLGGDMDEEYAEEEEMVVEEELALMPREGVIDEVNIRTTDTDVTFLNDSVAFVRTTVIIGDEPEVVGAVTNDDEAEVAEDMNDELVEEEELAVRPEPRHVEMQLGAVLIREEGEWRVKSLMTSPCEHYQQ